MVTYIVQVINISIFEIPFQVITPQNAKYRVDRMVFEHLSYNLLVVFVGGPIVYGVQRVGGAPFLEHFSYWKSTKMDERWKNYIPKSGEGLFPQKIILNQTIHVAYCWTFWKFLKYYSISFRVMRWFVELDKAFL